MSFNWYKHRDTQKTYRGLNSEVIELFGIPIRYMPKTTSEKSEFGNDPNNNSGFGIDSPMKSNTEWNQLYGEDPLIAYNNAIRMKGMLENYDFYEGTHQIFNKFGFSMSDEITLTFEIETFRNIMDMNSIPYNRPEEGDLIAFELAEAKNNKFQLFEINYVNESFSYFSFGQLSIFKVRCKVFQYSMEKIETGEEKIDQIKNINPATMIGDNDMIEKESNKVTNYHPNDPFKDIFDD